MTMYEFRLLTDQEQLDIVHSKGVYIGKRKVKELTSILYQVDGFYIELFYRRYRYHISHIRCSSSIAAAEPYLDQIDLAELVGQN
ncbi:MAG TPA: hypothetical protein VGD17_12010 [Chitinophagaceae bacterium]